MFQQPIPLDMYSGYTGPQMMQQFPSASPMSSRHGTPAIDPRKQAMLLSQLQQLQHNQTRLDEMMAHSGAMPQLFNQNTTMQAPSYSQPFTMPTGAPPRSAADKALRVKLNTKPENSKVKTGYMEIIMNGVPHRAYLESAQSVFKGNAHIYLCDSNGNALTQSEPLISFSLGSLGNLKVVLADKTLSLQDGDDAALLTTRTALDAQEWGAFLTASPLANKLTVREGARPPPTPPVMRAASYRSPRLGSRGRTDGGSEVLLARPSVSKDDRSDLPTHSENEEEGDANVKIIVEPRKTQLVLDQEEYASVCALKERIEGKIKHNSEAYCIALWEKEKTVVGECRKFRGRERRRVRAAYDKLQERLQAKYVLPAERIEESVKLNDWLTEQLAGINRLSGRREERAELEFEKFREMEYSRLCKTNLKLDAQLGSVIAKRDRVAARLGMQDPVLPSVHFQAAEDARRWERQEYLISILAQEADPKDIKLFLPDESLEKPDFKKIMAGDKVVVGTGEQEEVRLIVIPQSLVLDRPFSLPHPEGTTVKFHKYKSNRPPELDPVLLLGLDPTKLTNKQRATITRMRLLMGQGKGRTDEDRNDTSFCANIIQRAWRACVRRREVAAKLAEIRAARDRTKYLITKVQSIVRGRRGRRYCIWLMRRKLALAENMALFTIKLHLIMYAARWRRKRHYHEGVMEQCLERCLARRQKLILLRRKQAVDRSQIYRLAPPASRSKAVALVSGEAEITQLAAGEAHRHHAPEGMTDMLLNHALNKVDERMRHGDIMTAIRSRVLKKGHGLKRLLDGFVSMEGAARGLLAHHDDQNLTSAGRTVRTGGVSLEQLRGDELRHRAVEHFIALKQREKVKWLENIEETEQSP